MIKLSFEIVIVFLYGNFLFTYLGSHNSEEHRGTSSKHSCINYTESILLCCDNELEYKGCEKEIEQLLF